ncbi:ArsA family ATPase [Pseudalkalibacillus caeni]|uniref:ArsA family ATPase n=1 Tax=Exobacillus caeni TaxID=2574798 RepID=A0A5R9F7F0_9BACL|nr:ArsA family ATPase [Pseudalkalibacillus caeni]TLS38449.1 ArsA family ATPase [Pseudalkalibacillus caeni]
MKKLFEKDILFVGGKGGVGKSTSAAAMAFAAAESGKKTLLVSTDPAHNLGDIFHEKVGGVITKLNGALWALEIDPELEVNTYIQSIKENLKGLVKPQMAEEVYKQIDTASASPGAEEAALFDKMVSLILEEGERFDLIVFDTAPTGHTVRLLTLPELMGVWIDGMLERRKKTNENYTQLLNDGEPVEDPIFNVLQERRQRFAAVRKIILDQENTGFLFVLNPERLPILETEKAIEFLKKNDIYVKDLIINKVLPDDADGSFLAKRREIEQHYLEVLRKTFSEQNLYEVPLFEEDINSPEKLELFAKHIASAV